MEECVNQTMMPSLPTTVNKGHNSRTEKVVKFEIKLVLPVKLLSGN
jgi:hypothetical protein